MSKMENFGKLCFVVLAILISYIIGGYVFMKLWQWFVVYAFAVPSLSLIQSIGIMFIVGFMKYSYKYKEESITWDNIIEQFKGVITFYIITLILGYLITLLQ